MSPCRRFEQEGLLVIHQGGRLDQHFDRCPDCVAARATYQRLEARLGVMGAGSLPPPDWQSAVWSAIRPRTPRSRIRWALGLATATGLILGLVWLTRLRMPAHDVILAARIEAGAGHFRGLDDARPGQVLVLHARVGRAPHAELRLYRDDRRVVMACSSAAPCRRTGDVLDARVTLEAIGIYQPVLLVSGEAIPAPGGRLDEDAGAAHRQGARVTLSDPIVVR